MLRPLILLAVAALAAPVTLDARADEPSLPTADVELPKLIHRVDPAWPSGVPRSGSRAVTLQAVIGADGAVGDIRVVATDDARINEAAIRAVRQWKYEPARQHGRPIAIYFTIIVRFTHHSGGPAVVQPRLLDRVEPTYPADLLAQQLNGHVELELQVNSQGRVQAVRVLEATHEAFAAAALLAVQKWRYRPATDLGKPVAAQLTERIEFRWDDVGKKRRRR